MFELWKNEGNQELKKAIDGFESLPFLIFEGRIQKTIELYDRAPYYQEDGKIDNYLFSQINKNKSVAVRNYLERLVVKIRKDLD